MDTVDNKVKRCPKCGETKPLTAEFWHRNKSTKYGFASSCKPCRTEKERQYNSTEKRKKKIREGGRIYRKSEKGKATLGQYEQTRKGQRKEYNKKYGQSEKCRERKKQYRASTHGQEVQGQYATSKGRKKSLRRYEKTEKYKENRERYRRSDKGKIQYIKHQICNRYSLCSKDITPEMVELKKEQLELYRALKEATNGIT